VVRISTLSAGLLLLTVSPALSPRAAAQGAGASAQASPRKGEKPVESPEQVEKSCRAFVQDFYDGYLRELKKESTPPDLTLKYRPAALARDLLRQLREDHAAQAKNRDEIVGLDFDPYLNAQDIADRYVLGAVRRQGTTYRVEVFGVWEGRKSAKPDVEPELAYQGGRWTFVNFHYGRGQASGSDNLLSILRQLRKERQQRR
jgi:hypothetical protein